MNSTENWQVNINEQIYVADFNELIQWINEGAVLPQDKVKHGDLRWLEARKVPLLYEFFNPEEFDIDISSFLPSENNVEFQNDEQKPVENLPPQNAKDISDQTVEQMPTGEQFCVVHPEAEPKYICNTCKSLFCKICPKSFGGNVKICLFCGAMCKNYVGLEDFRDKNHGAINKPYARKDKNQNQTAGRIFGKKFSGLQMPDALGRFILGIKRALFSER